VVVPVPVAGVGTVIETTGDQTLSIGNGITGLKLFGYHNDVTGTHGGLTVTGDDGLSTFHLGGGNNTLVVLGHDDDIHMGGVNNTVIGSLANSSIILTGNGDVNAYGYTNTISVGDGVSSISGVAGYSHITAGAGGANSGTIVAAGNGNIITTNTSAGGWMITAGNNEDTVHVNGGVNTINLAGYHNIVTVSTGSADVTGGYGNTYALTNVAGSFNVHDFNLASGDILDLAAVTSDPTKVLLTALSATDTQVSVLQGGSSYIVANLHGASASAFSVGHGLNV
jgi:hypothetical protein